jgi:hypothetical protein
VPGVSGQRLDDARFRGEFATEHDNDLSQEVDVDAISLGSVDPYLALPSGAVVVRLPVLY